MATVLGAGGSLTATWLLDPIFAPVPSAASPAGARTREASPAYRPADHAGHAAASNRPDEDRDDGVATDAPDALDLLARVVWVLGSGRHASQGLSLTELRTLLAEPPSTLQRALAAGLRTKRLRRVGAHNKLRYLLTA
jgi:hypothetical protein